MRRKPPDHPWIVRIVVLTLTSARSARNGHGCQAGAWTRVRRDVRVRVRHTLDGRAAQAGVAPGGGPARSDPSPGAARPTARSVPELGQRGGSKAFSMRSIVGP